MLKALIVDDDIAVIQCFEKLIDWNTLGYDRPYTAINGSEAYDIVVKHDISVVICDLKMPVMGGMEFIRLLRENNIKSQIILFSAYEDFTAACEGIELKVFDYMLKPLVLGTIERMSENLRKISVLRWLERMVDGEFNSDVVDRFRHGDVVYMEELFRKINMLEETIENEHILQRIYVELSRLITVFLRELGFSEVSIKYNHEKLVKQIDEMPSHKERIHLLHGKICNIMKVTAECNQNKTQDNIAIEIKHYIDQNCSCTMADISERFSYSEGHINRLFRKNEGITVNQYILQIRMEQARQLILETDMSMGEISKKLGYNSLNYFTSSFRTFYGLPPTAFRDKRENLKFYNNGMQEERDIDDK